MEKFKVSFTADNQQLKAIGTKHASDTYADIEAEFVLGNRWTDMDSVSAVWWNDFTRIATVLDSQGKCIVPHEVLTRKGCVRVNLVGSVMEGDELVTRLTSYSAEAVQVNEKIKLTGSETSEITPSQFEQFVAIVISEVEKVTGMTAEAETLPAGSDATARYENGVLHLGIPQGIQGETGNGIASVTFEDYALKFTFTDGTVFTTPSIRGAEGNGIRSITKTGTSGLVDTYTITFDDGSTTTYTVTNGAKGDKGDTGATPSFSIGTVETLEPTEGATATITGTAENPVLNLGIPQGRTGEVTYEDLESILPRDTASGQIASFPDGQSVVPLHSLKVSLEPIQPCTPWMGSEEYNNPYLLQSMPTISEAYNTEYLKKVVGGTVAWNQLMPINGIYGTVTVKGVTFTNNGDGSVTINGTATDTISGNDFRAISPATVISGHKYLFDGCPVGGSRTTYFVYDGYNLRDTGNGTVTIPQLLRCAFYAKSGTSFNNAKFVPQIFDLTAMLGTTIADYIYSLEQATAGSGVAWFKSLFPLDYYPYNSGELLSVQTSAHVTKDGNGQQIASYPLDSSLTLRGIPKLDAQNNLYYDGDEYKSDGTVTRRYGVVDLGSLTWIADGGNVYHISLADAKNVNDANAMTDAPYTHIPQSATAYGKIYKTVWGANGLYVYFRNDSTASVNDFITTVQGKHLVYELATPTTESALPYTSQQSVDDGGTEEFVSSNVVPVGHVSSYARVCPIEGYTEVNTIVSPTTSASDGTTYTTDLGRTVYGGTLDVVSGELTITDGYIASYNGEALPSTWISDRDVYASGTTPSIGAEVVYKLASPQTIQLTPTEVRTLLGQNNVWSDGDVVVVYSADTALWIEKKLNA